MLIYHSRGPGRLRQAVRHCDCRIRVTGAAREHGLKLSVARRGLSRLTGIDRDPMSRNGVRVSKSGPGRPRASPD